MPRRHFLLKSAPRLCLVMTVVAGPCSAGTAKRAINMKYNLACISALVLLPFPTVSFCPALSPLASKPRISCDRCSNNHSRRPSVERIASQAIGLPGDGGVGTSDASSLPPPLPREGSPSEDSSATTPAYDRSKLGLHINLGSKVINP